MAARSNTGERITPGQILGAGSLCELFQATVAAQPDDVALRASDGGLTLTWREYGERVRQIAAGLAGLGVRRGDTVALMLTNRPEFHLVDTAAMHLGAIPFSIYNTSSPEQIEYLFSNAGNRLVIYEEQFAAKLDGVARRSGVERVVNVDDGGFDELERAATSDHDFDAWRSIGPDDLLTLIYTSGTTGPPKGVEITHGNILFSTGTALHTPELVNGGLRGGRAISYLPDAHLANRWSAHYLAMATGATVTTVRDAKTVAAVLQEVHPTNFVGVPMLWYKLKAAVEQAIAADSGLRGSLASWALDTGRARVRLAMSGERVPLSLRARHAVADRLVLSKLVRRIGFDQAGAPITGGAPISPEAMEFLLAIGVPVCEGWAMSETSAVGLRNPPDAIRPGTVGKPPPGVEVRLGADGELLYRSPGVMKGYRHDPVKTAETIDADGWLHTGDIATIDDDGYVRIVDRKKELIINYAGKNMSPANIENAVKVACPLVGSVVAIGEGRKYIVALVTLDPEAAAGYGSDPAALARHPEVDAAVRAGVERANATLSRVEQIKAFTILPAFWEPSSDELTPTMKLKRKVIAGKYADEIDALYETTASRSAMSHS
jgi:long-subunit acyl-CoA synthetase (AMP-forming)